MRLTTGLLRVLLLAVAACRPGAHDLAPPVVVEPEEGATFDRCIVRVRSDLPGDDWNPGNGWGVETGRGSHANWRVNGGRIHEAERPTYDAHPDTPFQFSVLLEPGPNALEIGRCDEVDYCVWLERPVTVLQRAGSPDCALGRGGFVMLADHVQLRSLVPHPDGTFLAYVVGSGAGGLVKLDAQGKLDARFGGTGIARPGEYVFGMIGAALPDGGWVTVITQGNGVQHLAWLGADGTLDLTKGTDGLLRMPAGDSAGFSATAMRRQDDGSLLLAGLASVGDPARTRPFVLQLDATGAVLASRAIGTGPDASSGWDWLFLAALDDDGVAWFLNGRTVVAGDLLADVTTFGNAGAWTLPEVEGLPEAPVGFSANAGKFSVAVRSPTLDGSARGHVLLVDGAVTTRVALTPALHDPFATLRVIHLAMTPSGATYAAFASPKLPRTMWGFTSPPAGGSSLLLTRIVNSAVDATFGSAGYATIEFEDAHLPVAVDASTDVPFFLQLDAQQRPLVGGSTSAPPGATSGVRGTSGASLVRVLP